MQPVTPSESLVGQPSAKRSLERSSRTKNRPTDPSPLPPALPEQDPPRPDEPPVAEPDRPGRERRIAERAYGLFLGRGQAEGGDIDDWLEAERQVDVDEPAR